MLEVYWDFHEWIELGMHRCTEVLKWKGVGEESGSESIEMVWTRGENERVYCMARKV